MESWFRFHYQNSTSFSFPPFFSCLLLFCSVSSRLTPPTNQDRSLSWSSVLGFHPSLPGQWPASAALLWEHLAAIITSGTQALGLPHRWHVGEGGCRGLKGGKGGSFFAADRGYVRTATALPATSGARINPYTLPYSPNLKKDTQLTLKRTNVTITHYVMLA